MHILEKTPSTYKLSVYLTGDHYDWYIKYNQVNKLIVHGLIDGYDIKIKSTSKKLGFVLIGYVIDDELFDFISICQKTMKKIFGFNKDNKINIIDYFDIIDIIDNIGHKAEKGNYNLTIKLKEIKEYY